MSNNQIFIDKKTDIIMHFNKKHLEDSNIPMWTLKFKARLIIEDKNNLITAKIF